MNIKRILGLVVVLISAFLLLAIMFGLLGGNAFAYKRGEPLKVFEATCPKAQEKFYRLSKNACIRKGMVLKNTYPDKCLNNMDPRNNLEKVKLEGTYVCDLRL